MPFFWNNRLVVTKDELVPAFYCSQGALAKAIQRYKGRAYGIKRVLVGGNGRRLLVCFDSLPAEVRLALGDPRGVGHILERYFSFSAEAARFFGAYEFGDGSLLGAEFQERYVVNASVLLAVLALREDRVSELVKLKGRLSGLWAKMLGDVVSFNGVLWAKHGVRHSLPLGEKQFKRVVRAFEVSGFVSLVSLKHRNGNSRKVTDVTLGLLRNMFADKVVKPTVADVQRLYNRFIDGELEVINNGTGECYNRLEFKRLSMATVNKYLCEWGSRLATHQRRSDNRVLNMGKFKPFYSFEMPKFSGSILSIDDRQPAFKLVSGARIWFYLGVDIASRAITCWVYGQSKEGIIMEFYRQLVRNYAAWGLCLPAELECEMSLNSGFRGSFLRPGVMFDFVKMEANNARGKYIERVNGELRYRKEKGRVGFLARPKALREANQPGLDVDKVARLPYERIVAECLQDIEDWNNEPHPQEKGKSKWDYFMANQHPDLKPINYRAFIKHIGYRTQTSCHVGNIKLNRDLFLIAYQGRVACGDRLIGYMNRIEGKVIDVYWLDDNQGEVLRAFAFLGGEYVCEVMRKPRPNRARIERGEQDAAHLEVLAAYTNTVDGFARRQMGLLDRVTVVSLGDKPKRGFRIDGLRGDVVVEPVVEVLPDIEQVDVELEVPLYRTTLKERF